MSRPIRSEEPKDDQVTGHVIDDVVSVREGGGLMFPSNGLAARTNETSIAGRALRPP